MMRIKRKIGRLPFLFIVLLLGTRFSVLHVRSAAVAGVVGNGTPDSCTEAALDIALSGGGLVTFNCGAAPHTILLSYTKQIAEDTEIQGANLVTLSGNNTTSHFQVFFGKSLTLRDLTISRGNGTFGAIENFGTLHLVNTQVTFNNANTSGGAIQNHGTVFIDHSTLADNSASLPGGGIHNDTGRVTISDTVFARNRAINQSGGGIWSSGAITVTQSSFIINQAAYQGGGGIFNTGALSLDEVVFEQTCPPMPARQVGVD